ncbi:MAG TPA: sulfatase [Candidatus Binatia bacterium]|nr:sulfatase [Candidatus Binatia bacterium]
MTVVGRVLGFAFAAVLAAGRVASSADRRPSFVLVVLDTVRYDAVSIYGKVGTSTPTVDALARRGLLYRHAYANANWTLPSHVTLFTGLLPSQHGVNAVHFYAPDALVTLAERLRDAGYETIGVSDNPYVGKDTNLTQGFDRFVSLENPMTTGFATVDVESAVRAWLSARNGDRPYFLFVNLMDAHAPYKNHPQNPFLVVDPQTATHVAQDDRYLCSPLSSSPDMDILWSLYIGGVAAADARLGALLRQLRNAGASDGSTVIIVTADHGEHFGEHRLILHDYGVYDELLHVPLVVVGAPGAATGSIEEAVQLADIEPSILAMGRSAPRSATRSS